MADMMELGPAYGESQARSAAAGRNHPAQRDRSGWTGPEQVHDVTATPGRWFRFLFVFER
ncbi:Hypothetical protein SMAX5B_021721 [Scophthalmus maximus]|uniref:Uncharacterized protein n=1 Tax=Scophthalmus maximus TaxID=52904 RepID=A0A2U9CH93_SCOMX|nr:Hypothetical protein SMAX5B_021721 [Scophthalmus maximus]